MMNLDIEDNPNQEIYDRHYTGNQLQLNASCDYDREIIRLRQAYISKYGHGKDVLDLCCGSGSYLIPELHNIRFAFGVDFSANMLKCFRERLGGAFPENLSLSQEDACELSLPDNCVDLVFSYTALYYVPNIGRALKQVARVMRSGGVGVFELGNLWSLNTLVCNYQYKHEHWAKPFYIPFSTMAKLIADAGLEVVERRSFQLLPMYGTPRGLFWLAPLLSPYWKKLMGISIRGKLLDERLSTIFPFSRFAFRHFWVVRKP